MEEYESEKARVKPRRNPWALITSHRLYSGRKTSKR